MLIALHCPNETEPCAQLRRLLRRVSSRALALFQKRDAAAGCSVNDWLQIENELAFRDQRRPC
jgi:hypothetical protein